MTERELVLQFLSVKRKRDALKEELKSVQKEYDRAETAIIEHLENNSAEATARYEGVGYVKLMKPRLYASCTKDNFESLQHFLEKEQRTDLIKQTVAPQSLSAYATELIDQGKAIPECINYYFKQSVRLF